MIHLVFITGGKITPEDWKQYCRDGVIDDMGEQQETKTYALAVSRNIDDYAPDLQATDDLPNDFHDKNEFFGASELDIRTLYTNIYHRYARSGYPHSLCPAHGLYILSEEGLRERKVIMLFDQWDLIEKDDQIETEAGDYEIARRLWYKLYKPWKERWSITCLFTYSFHLATVTYEKDFFEVEESENMTSEEPLDLRVNGNFDKAQRIAAINSGVSAFQPGTLYDSQQEEELARAIALESRETIGN